MTDVNDEILQKLCSLNGMEYLRMELDSPYRLRLTGVGSIFHIGGRSDALESFGNSGNGIAMTHPHLTIGFEAFEERVSAIEFAKVGTSIFA